MPKAKVPGAKAFTGDLQSRWGIERAPTPVTSEGSLAELPAVLCGRRLAYWAPQLDPQLHYRDTSHPHVDWHHER